MRNDEQSGARSALSRKKVFAGAAGLAAVLSGGGYLLADHLSEPRIEAADVGVLAPPVASAAAAATSTPTAAASATEAAATEAGASPHASKQAPAAAPESISPEVRRQIDEARRRMAEDGVEVKRPLAPGTTATANDVKMTTQGSLNSGGIVRMVTARGDLTGQRELAWVSGGVQKYRDVPCSQTIRVSPDQPPAKKANLLICWRTSAKKSVISIVVDPKGHPSRDKAVDALEKKWRSMG